MSLFDQYLKKECRYCNSKLPHAILELGIQPLANSFIKKDEAENSEFTCPLTITRCTHCGLVQLTHIVPADLMFSHYLYVSSTTKTFQVHFAEYAKDLKERSFKKENLLAVDIGSNDGLLVSCYMKEGMKALGVDPAKNLAEDANKRGITTINNYFNEETVAQIKREYGNADIISGNNVFAHIDDIQSVCKNVANLLSDTGIFVIEFPYMAVMLEDMVFDMIYHEHVSYINITPLKYLMSQHQLEIFDIKKVASHGGSLRVFIQKKAGVYKVTDTVTRYLNEEEQKGYNKQQTYIDFSDRVANVKTTLLEFVNTAKKENKTIAGYGAPAKGNTIINYCNFTPEQINFIVDDNPMKQNMLTPGAKIPVVNSQYLAEHPTDYVIIFAWNFAEEIIKNNKQLKEKGIKFIVPLPKPEII